MDALYGFSGRPDERLLSSMGRILEHRGSEEVRDASPQGSMGIRFRPEYRRAIHQDGDLSLAIVGQLTDNGRPVDQPNLSSLANRWRREGQEGLEHLRGAFVLVLRDGDRWLLMRDAAGVRTMYWALHEKRLRFAIEPKSILADRSIPRRVRPGAVTQYLSYSFCPGTETMLEGLFELKPAHRLTWTPGSEPVQTRWYRYDDPVVTERSEEQWCEDFRRAMGDAVRERLSPGHGPVGVFLSGGLDSSVVAAEVRAQTSRPLYSYTIHFGDDYPNELPFARSVAERLGTEHRELCVSPQDFVPRLRRIAWHLDDPIGDPIAVPNFELAAMAAGEVSQIYNGEGGDPCFGGPKNLGMLLHHWYGGTPREPGFRERWYLESYRRAYPERDRLLSPEWRALTDDRRDLEQVLTPYFERDRPARFLDKLMLINIQLKGAHLILPKVDRMLGAWGLCASAPLFDERMLDFSFSLPGELKLHHGVEKVILKKVYRDCLPAPVIDRPKSGMRVPVHWWFLNEMKDFAREILDPTALRRVGIFNPARVQQLLSYSTTEGPGRYGLRLWMLMTFELWRRLVIEGESP